MTLGYAKDLWLRATNAVKSAEALLSVSSDDAASRAYYGGGLHVQREDVEKAIEGARGILNAILV